MVELSECCFRGCSGCNIYYGMFGSKEKEQEKEDNNGSVDR